MAVAIVLVDAFNRVRDAVHDVVDGLSVEDLLLRVDRSANPIGWLIWHLTRVEDDHIAKAADVEQVWTAEGFVDDFMLPYDRDAIGYGQSVDQVGEFTITSGALLLAYHDAVHAQTLRFVEALTDDDLDRIVDKRWNPPVTLSVRLVSVISDALQHAGQAAYVRGMALRD